MVADVIVVGLGAMGSAVAYRCAKRGLKVIGIDRFSPPHDQGSSHGETRITRQAVGEGDAYVPLVLRSHALWREIEAETGESLFDACGIVMIGRSDDPEIYHGKPGFIANTIEYARRFGIDHEVLAPSELARRFPQFRPRGDEACYVEPGGGMVFPERCIAAQLGLARSLGARLVTGETVTGIARSGSGVAVTTDRGRYEAAEVVLSAGAWNPGLAGGRLSMMRILRQALFWFEPDGSVDYASSVCPTYIWVHGSGEAFYGFPTPRGGRGAKVATEQYERASARPEDVDRTTSDGEGRALFDHHLAHRLAGLTPRVLRSATCLYTNETGGRFVIDRSPDDDRILLVSPCSGHGFKHSAGIGDLVAETLATGRMANELAPFGLGA